MCDWRRSIMTNHSHPWRAHPMQVLAVAVAFQFLALATDLPKPPATRADNVKEVVHGREIVDPYRWLENQDSPETRAWINAQMSYTRSRLDARPDREALRRLIEPLIRYDLVSAPVARGGKYFFSKRPKDKNQAILYMRLGSKGKDEILLDANSLTADQTSSASWAGFSLDGRLVAVSIRSGGEDETRLVFFDTDTRQRLEDEMPRARYGSVQILPDRSGFYYMCFTEKGPRAYFHKFGAKTTQDEVIFGSELGTRSIMGLQVSEDGRWLAVYVDEGVPAEQTEVHVRDLQGGSGFRPLVRDIKARFSGVIRDGRCYLLTNWKAPNGRIIAIDLAKPAPENWKDVVAEGKWAIQGFTSAGKRLFVSYLENVVDKVRIFDPSGKPLGEIPAPRLGSMSAPSGTWTSDEAFYSFTSFAEPSTAYRYEISTGRREIWNQNKVSVDPAAFEVKQVWYESRDKTRVPMFLVHKKGLKLDGARPVLLTGYGGFNSSSTPAYSNTAILMAEIGGVFALANLRGGGEFGESWHRAGMFENKQNVFDDFIAAGEWLVKNNYTQPAKLAILGTSNGGLLVGAVLTQRPDLFGAVICGSPLLDMVRYQQFKVARWWTAEYGSSEDPKQFEYIYRYSPYHNVKPGTKYPAVLFITGDADTRVDPLHARKMAALVQAYTTSGQPVLLHYDAKMGHSGGLPVTQVIDDTVDTMSFLTWQLGISVQ